MTQDLEAMSKRLDAMDARLDAIDKTLNSASETAIYLAYDSGKVRCEFEMIKLALYECMKFVQMPMALTDEHSERIVNARTALVAYQNRLEKFKADRPDLKLP